MKAAVAALVMAAILGMTAIAATPASAFRTRPPTTPIVETGTTARFSGGQWVHVRIGDVSLGVVWSTNGTLPSGLTLFLDYTRYFGGAEIYDDQGTFLRSVTLPLHSILVQHFDRMVEFRDLDNDSLFDLQVENRTVFLGDPPMKVLSLDTAWHLDGSVEKFLTADSAWVNFTVSASRVPYASIFDAPNRTWQRPGPADGVLDRITFTFRLAASARAVTLDIPFYHIVLADGNVRMPASSTFLGNRTVSGVSRTVDGKYDQRIEGWDFAASDSKLALGTTLTFGTFIADPVVQWLRSQFSDACLRDGGFTRCVSQTGPSTPQRITNTELRIMEGWNRTGAAYWTSSVTVDGRADTMTFEIYRADDVQRIEGGYAKGVLAWGAFVYPQGQTIVHDPGLNAASVLPLIDETTNVAPSLLVGVQLAIIGVALGPALLLRRRKQTPKGGRRPPVFPAR